VFVIPPTPITGPQRRPMQIGQTRCEPFMYSTDGYFVVEDI